MTIVEPKPEPACANRAVLDDQQLAEIQRGAPGPSPSGDGVVVGLIEEVGIDYTHGELGGTGNLDFDRQAVARGTHPAIAPFFDAAGSWVDPIRHPLSAPPTHGDATARCIAGRAPSGAPPLGVAPRARIRYATTTPAADRSHLAQALRDLTDVQRNPVRVIAVPHAGALARKDAVERAVAAGIVVVEAHGANERVAIGNPPPGCSLVVSAYDVATHTNVASYGPGLTLLACGQLGTDSQSMATALVAGTVALLLEAHPDWQPFDVMRAVTQTAFKPPAMGRAVFSDELGWGLLRASAALRLTTADLLPLPPVEIGWDPLGGAREMPLSWRNRPTANEVGMVVGLFRDPDHTGFARPPEVELRFGGDHRATRVRFPTPGRWRIVLQAEDRFGRRSEIVPSVIVPPGAEPFHI
ncbi:MAG: S8 family serine peptidase [bacterium]